MFSVEDLNCFPRGWGVTPPRAAPVTSVDAAGETRRFARAGGSRRARPQTPGAMGFFDAARRGDDGRSRRVPTSKLGTSFPLLDLPDAALAVVLKHLAAGPDGVCDIARFCLVSKPARELGLDTMRRRMRSLDLTPLGRRARNAVPHLAATCANLRTITCDGTNVTDACVTALLACSERTLTRLSLADCRHLRLLHEHSHGAGARGLRELVLRGSSWSLSALAGILRRSRKTLTSLNLSGTRLALTAGDNDLRVIAARVLRCRALERLSLGSHVDVLPAALATVIFALLDGDERIDDDDDVDVDVNVDVDVDASSTTPTTTPDDVDDAFGLDNLKELSLAQNGAADEKMLEIIARRCPSLTKLDLRGCTASRDAVCAFVRNAACASSLTSLLLGGAADSLDDASLEAVASSCPSLEELDLGMHHAVGIAGMESLRVGCVGLRRLRISRNARVTTQSLASLVKTEGSKLELLSAVRCRRAGEPGLRSLQRDLEVAVGAGAGCRIDWVGEYSFERDDDS